ncbi:MAG: glycosyltransferase family 4 protein [Pirellulales bacterium]|nr:glycosyltransferase family 4 protein [Pirellulales bacterium]
MSYDQPVRVGYVLKRYPRYSETFIVNEILAHEAAGLELDIFSLRPPSDSHFQDRLAKVRAPVRYLTIDGAKAAAFWSAVDAAADVLPGFWTALKKAQKCPASEVHQAIVLARLVRTGGITHLHAHFATEATGVARLAAAFAGVPYTFTAHAKDIFHESADAADRRQKLADAAAVVTVSDYNCRYLQDTFGEAAAHVRRIYNGLELADFPYRSPREREATVVAVGRLVEKKGFADLVDSCAVLARRGRRLRCRIIGEGELQEDLRRRISAAGVEGLVELLGPRPQSEVIGIVQEAAVFAAPCVVGSDGNRDGLPTVLLEAMALGTPCISTDVTGIPEVVRHGDTGMIVPQHDPESLADQIERLLDSPDLRTELAERARELIAAEFDIHRNTAQMRKLFGGSCAAVSSAPADSLQEVG